MSSMKQIFRSFTAAACVCGASAKWAESQKLGSSGDLAEGSAVPYKEEKITWEASMKGHSDYDLYDVKENKAALLVIDPQAAYSACPAKLEVPDLINPPTDKDFKGQSPLCCEKFDSVVKNANTIATAMRKKDLPVFVVAHVYRDTDGDKKVDNCGRLCDFDVLGWTKWPMAFNLWNEAMPWSKVVYKTKETPNGFDADFEKDFYTEKSTYSAMTKPVVAKLKELGVDTVIITGFMAQFCSVTTARHAHDLGFKVVYVVDGNDGPKLLELLSGVDENKFIPFTLGVAVADTIPTAGVLKALGEDVDEAEAKWELDMPSLVHEQQQKGYSGVALVGACCATALVTFVLVGMAAGLRRFGAASRGGSPNSLLVEAGESPE